MVGQRGGQHPEHPGPPRPGRSPERVLHVRGERERVPLLQRHLVPGHAYGGMLTVLTGIDSFKTIRTSRAWRAATVLVLAAIWYGIGQSISTSGSDTAVSAVLNSLTLMLYLLVPWTALNLVDFFFVRRGHYAITDIFRPDGVYGAWGWRGLTAYFVGFAAEIPFMVLPPIFGLSYTGWIPNHVTNGVDYSWVVGLLVSGLVYLILSRSLDLAAEREAIKASERELLTIDQEQR